MRIRMQYVRTTIELRDEQRARLLALAARRGQKGFSGLVQEAIERYLDEELPRQDRIGRALALAGSLSAADADRLEAAVHRVRGT